MNYVIGNLCTPKNAPIICFRTNSKLLKGESRVRTLLTLLYPMEKYSVQLYRQINDSAAFKSTVGKNYFKDWTPKSMMNMCFFRPSWRKKTSEETYNTIIFIEQGIYFIFFILTGLGFWIVQGLHNQFGSGSEFLRVVLLSWKYNSNNSKLNHPANIFVLYCFVLIREN